MGRLARATLTLKLCPICERRRTMAYNVCGACLRFAFEGTEIGAPKPTKRRCRVCRRAAFNGKSSYCLRCRRFRIETALLFIEFKPRTPEQVAILLELVRERRAA